MFGWLVCLASPDTGGRGLVKRGLTCKMGQKDHHTGIVFLVVKLINSGRKHIREIMSVKDSAYWMQNSLDLHKLSLSGLKNLVFI